MEGRDRNIISILILQSIQGKPEVVGTKKYILKCYLKLQRRSVELMIMILLPKLPDKERKSDTRELLRCHHKE